MPAVSVQGWQEAQGECTRRQGTQGHRGARPLIATLAGEHRDVAKTLRTQLEEVE